MKVKVSFYVDVDPKAWEDEYGVSGVEAIRRDVLVHAANSVSAHFESVGVLTEAGR